METNPEIILPPALLSEEAELIKSLPQVVPVEKPDISHLKDALDSEGKPLFGPGDKILIERYCSFLDGWPYLDTKTFRVTEVDLDDGSLRLWDEEIEQFAMDNFIRGPKFGQKYKFAKGKPVAPKKRRGRPPKLDMLGEAANKPKIEKRRGRPPGVKNRPRAVIQAEKEAKKKLKKRK